MASELPFIMAIASATSAHPSADQVSAKKKATQVAIFVKKVHACVRGGGQHYFVYSPGPS